MNKRINALHVGSSGIPFGKSASVNRCLAIYNLLPKDRYSLLAINNKINDFSIKSVEYCEDNSGISYLFTSLNQGRSKFLLKRRIDRLINKINEFLILFKLGSKNKIDLIFFYPNGSFIDLLIYSIFSKVIGVPIVLHYVEYRSKFDNVRTFWQKINYLYFDKYFMFLVDGVIPISEVLIENINAKKENLPFLKIPPIVDFNKFNKRKQTNSVDYFLYVGSASYDKALEIILDSFGLVRDKKFFLYMILSGDSKNTLTKITEHKKKNLIKVFSNLDYSELVKYNINARALLIPLSDRIQDKARFPQKISEYLASKNPIITTSVGEINYYFTDELNALIAEPDNALSFSDKMNWLIKNPIKAENIGVLGYQLGLDFFNSSSYKDRLDKFLLNLTNSSTKRNDFNNYSQ